MTKGYSVHTLLPGNRPALKELPTRESRPESPTAPEADTFSAIRAGNAVRLRRLAVLRAVQHANDVLLADLEKIIAERDALRGGDAA